MALIKEKPATDFKVQINNGKLLPVRKQVLLWFPFADKQFQETFLMVPTMGNVLIGMSFSKQYSVTLDIHFPDVSLQLHEANGKYSCDMCELRAAQKIVLSPYQQVMIPVCNNAEIGRTTGTAEATPTITRKETLLVTLAIFKFEKDYTDMQISNPHDHIFGINAGAILAIFFVLGPNQAEHVKPFAPEHFKLLTQHPDDATAVINKLFHEVPTTAKLKVVRDTRDLAGPSDAQSTGATNPQCHCQPAAAGETAPDDVKSTAPDISQWIQWGWFPNSHRRKAQSEHLFVKYYKIFERHRLDIGINTELKVRLTSEHDHPVQAKISPTPTKMNVDCVSL